MCSGFEKGNNRSVLNNSYYILLYIDYLLFFTPKYNFCYHCWYCMGGRERGGVFVKQQDEYMYRCDIPPPPYPLPAPSLPQLSPIFVTQHVHIVHYLGPVQQCSFFSVKLKHVILLNYYPFSFPKSELLKTLKSNKK